MSRLRLVTAGDMPDSVFAVRNKETGKWAARGRLTAFWPSKTGAAQGLRAVAQASVRRVYSNLNSEPYLVYRARVEAAYENFEIVEFLITPSSKLVLDKTN